MFQAQYLPNGADLYSPWFTRQGDNLRATVDIVAVGSSGLLTVTVHTKNSDDTGDGGTALAEAAGDLSSVGVGRQWAEFGPGTVKELVRYKFSAATNWVMFRVLTPVWFDSVKP